MTNEQLEIITEVIPKNDSSLYIIEKLKNNSPLTYEDGEYLYQYLNKYYKNTIEKSEKIINEEHGRGAKIGIQSDQNAFYDMNKIIKNMKENHHDLLKIIKNLVKIYK